MAYIPTSGWLKRGHKPKRIGVVGHGRKGVKLLRASFAQPRGILGKGWALLDDHKQRLDVSLPFPKAPCGLMWVAMFQRRKLGGGGLDWMGIHLELGLFWNPNKAHGKDGRIDPLRRIS